MLPDVKVTNAEKPKEELLIISEEPIYKIFTKSDLQQVEIFLKTINPEHLSKDTFEAPVKVMEDGFNNISPEVHIEGIVKEQDSPKIDFEMEIKEPGSPKIQFEVKINYENSPKSVIDEEMTNDHINRLMQANGEGTLNINPREIQFNVGQNEQTPQKSRHENEKTNQIPQGVQDEISNSTPDFTNAEINEAFVIELETKAISNRSFELEQSSSQNPEKGIIID